MNQPPAPPYHAPQKKSGNGCMIALLIVGVLFLAGIGVMALGAFLFARSKPGKEIVDLVGKGARAVGEAAKVMEEASRAPGTREIRATGCRQAFAIDIDRLLKAIDQFDAGLPPAGAGSGPDLMLLCQVGVIDAAPACDGVARAYVGAVGRAPGKFSVLVNRDQAKRSECGAIYDPSGARLADFHGSAPVIPTAPP